MNLGFTHIMFSAGIIYLFDVRDVNSNNNTLVQSKKWNTSWESFNIKDGPICLRVMPLPEWLTSWPHFQKRLLPRLTLMRSTRSHFQPGIWERQSCPHNHLSGSLLVKKKPRVLDLRMENKDTLGLWAQPWVPHCISSKVHHTIHLRAFSLSLKPVYEAGFLWSEVETFKVIQLPSIPLWIHTQNITDLENSIPHSISLKFQII